MIGNDIVDLALAHKESNWKRPGFLNKIFTQNEQGFIFNAEKPEIMVWNLWSRKEATYKIVNRQTGIRAYIPLKLECFDVYNQIGKVICMGKCYFTKTEITSQYINTIAVVDRADFSRILFLDSETKIIKINNIPLIQSNHKIVSKSHHGNFNQVVTLS
jgi:phosphopantetheinyl transferase (holo-ACP synthase)